MYLTRYTLDITNNNIIKMLANAQYMHSSIQSLFNSARKDNEVLYFVKKDVLPLRVYITSLIEPSMISIDGFSERYSRDMDTMIASYTQKGTFNFHLSYVPAKKIKGDFKNSRRVFLTDMQDRMAFLSKKMEACGLKLLNARELKDNVSVDIEHNKKKGGCSTIRGVEIAGMCKIVNAELFQQKWYNGIGPEKAYGYGMLLLS
jgi:CRISPR-associated protein Cas6/Cse3/CasE subtype I-E